MNMAAMREADAGVFAAMVSGNLDAGRVSADRWMAGRLIDKIWCPRSSSAVAVSAIAIAVPVRFATHATQLIQFRSGGWHRGWSRPPGLISSSRWITGSSFGCLNRARAPRIQSSCKRSLCLQVVSERPILRVGLISRSDAAVFFLLVLRGRPPGQTPTCRWAVRCISLRSRDRLRLPASPPPVFHPSPTMRRARRRLLFQTRRRTSSRPGLRRIPGYVRGHGSSCRLRRGFGNSIGWWDGDVWDTFDGVREHSLWSDGITVSDRECAFSG